MIFGYGDFMKKILCFIALLIASIGANAQAPSAGLVGFNCAGVSSSSPQYGTGTPCNQLATPFANSGSIAVPSYAYSGSGDPAWLFGEKLQYNFATIASSLYSTLGSNLFFASPVSGTGQMSPRGIQQKDIPGSPVYQITTNSYSFPTNGDTTISSADTAGSVLDFITSGNWTANIYSNGCGSSGDITQGGYQVIINNMSGSTISGSVSTATCSGGTQSAFIGAGIPANTTTLTVPANTVIFIFADSSDVNFSVVTLATGGGGATLTGNNTFNGNQTINGNETISGALTASGTTSLSTLIVNNTSTFDGAANFVGGISISTSSGVAPIYSSGSGLSTFFGALQTARYIPSAQTPGSSYGLYGCDSGQGVGFYSTNSSTSNLGTIAGCVDHQQNLTILGNIIGNNITNTGSTNSIGQLPIASQTGNGGVSTPTMRWIEQAGGTANVGDGGTGWSAGATNGQWCIETITDLGTAGSTFFCATRLASSLGTTYSFTSSGSTFTVTGGATPFSKGNVVQFSGGSLPTGITAASSTSAGPTYYITNTGTSGGNQTFTVGNMYSSPTGSYTYTASASSPIIYLSAQPNPFNVGNQIQFSGTVPSNMSTGTLYCVLSLGNTVVTSSTLPTITIGTSCSNSSLVTPASTVSNGTVSAALGLGSSGSGSVSELVGSAVLANANFGLANGHITFTPYQIQFYSNGVSDGFFDSQQNLNMTGNIISTTNLGSSYPNITFTSGVSSYPTDNQNTSNAFTASVNNGTFTFTPTSTTPYVLTGESLTLSGTPPNNFSTGTVYYVICSSNPCTSTFTLSATLNNPSPISSTGTASPTVNIVNGTYLHFGGLKAGAFTIPPGLTITSPTNIRLTFPIDLNVIGGARCNASDEGGGSSAGTMAQIGHGINGSGQGYCTISKSSAAASLDVITFSAEEF